MNVAKVLALEAVFLILENSVDCAGLCEKSYLYIFRGVSDSPPKGKCQELLPKKINSMKNSFGGFMIFIGLYIAMLVGCCA